jgi:hypothetical protein
MVHKLLLSTLFLVAVISAQITSVNTSIQKKYFSTSDPGIVTDSRSGDIFFNTTNRKIFVCAAQSGYCSAIGLGNWTQILYVGASDVVTSLNGLNTGVQVFATGTDGNDFNISSSVVTHTFNLPTASDTNRGLLSSADWTAFNATRAATPLNTADTIVKRDGSGNFAAGTITAELIGNASTASALSGTLNIARMPIIADQRVLGNVSGGSAGAIALTSDQLTTMLVGTVTTSSAGGVTVSTPGFYWKAFTGTLTYTLPAISTLGMQYCFRGVDANTGAITITAPASTFLELAGTRGTAAGTLVSSGSAGDGVCVVAQSSAAYVAYISAGNWTNN